MADVSTNSPEPAAVPQVPSPESLIAQVDWGATEQTHDEDVQVDTTAAPDDQAAVSEPPQSDAEREQEKLARQRGWVAREEWRGKPSDWVDAQTYNRRSEQITPFIAKQAKQLRAELQERDRRIAEQEARLAILEKQAQEQAQAAEIIQFQTLQAQKIQAEQEGNYELANKLGNQLLDLKIAKVAPKAPAQEPQRPDQNVVNLMNEFFADNPTFKDQRMQIYLAREAKALAEASGGQLRGRELLDEARDEVMRRYADKFKQPQRRPAMAEMNGAPSRNNSAQRSWADLKPEEARKQEDFIRTTPAFAKLDDKGKARVRASILNDLPASAFRR